MSFEDPDFLTLKRLIHDEFGLEVVFGDFTMKDGTIVHAIVVPKDPAKLSRAVNRAFARQSQSIRVEVSPSPTFEEGYRAGLSDGLARARPQW